MLGEICYHDMISSATTPTAPSPPRHLTITRVCDDGIELNWIPPREPNGDIRHYTIKYFTQDETPQEINTTNNINYYNLTGLKRRQTYHIIRVVAVNSAGGGKSSQFITRYKHNPTVECTSELELEVLRIALEWYFCLLICIAKINFNINEILVSSTRGNKNINISNNNPARCSQLGTHNTEMKI